MRLVFMGTPEIAVPALEFLAQRHEVRLLVTAPARPRGRGQQLRESDAAQAARRLGLRVLAPEKLDPETTRAIMAERPQALVVVAYGKIIPSALHGELPCLNLHPSILPRHRGAAPIPWTIWSGDDRWGVTIMRIVRELDAGPIARQESWPLGCETAGELMRIAAERGAEMLLEAVDLLAAGRLELHDQVGEPTYARRLEPHDERLDFTLPAEALARQVRALAPRPGVRVRVAGRGLELRLLDAEALAGQAAPGQILDLTGRIGFGTGDGLLAVRTVQPAGRTPQAADAFLRGRPWAAGLVAQ